MNNNTRYDCVETCNKCNGNDYLINPIYESQFIIETKTICTECHYVDYWAYGHFESGAEMVGKCNTYYFDDNGIFTIEEFNE